MPARGRYGGRKKRTMRGHITATNKSIHPPTTLHNSSTAVHTTAVIPTKRSTHPLCATAAQQDAQQTVVDVVVCIRFVRSSA